VKKLVIGGYRGFIGTNLVKMLTSLDLSEYSEILLVDPSTRYANYFSQERISGVRYVIGELSVLKGVQADAILLNAQAGVAESLSNPERAVNQNYLEIVKFLSSNSIDKIIFSSTFGLSEDFSESARLRYKIETIYAATKAAAETFIAGYASSYQVQSTILRFGNVYGPYSFHKKNFIPCYIKSTLLDERFYLYGDGNQTRSFVHVNEVCDEILTSLKEVNREAENFLTVRKVAPDFFLPINTLRDILDAELARLNLNPPRVDFMPLPKERKFPNATETSLTKQDREKIANHIRDLIIWMTQHYDGLGRQEQS
jgi:UDP-glucose 4-epimerase